MPQGTVNPSNAILCAGTPVIKEMEIVTATSCYPGTLVIRDTTDNGVKIATDGATTCIGVLDMESTETRNTLYDAADQARVLTGPCEVLIRVYTGQTVTAGQTVIPATGGTVIAGTTAGAVVGVAKTTATGSTTDAAAPPSTFVKVLLLR